MYLNFMTSYQTFLKTNAGDLHSKLNTSVLWEKLSFILTCSDVNVSVFDFVTRKASHSPCWGARSYDRLKHKSL